MQVHDDHGHHGSALVQIAEDPHFTALNAAKLGKRRLHNTFLVNADTVVFLKYATKPKGSYKEYVFTFLGSHLKDLEKLGKTYDKVFVCLICVEGRQICSLPLESLMKLVDRRRKAKGAEEEQYTLLATLPEGKSFRVYVNAPAVRGKILGRPLTVSRTAFPKALFN